MFDNFHNNEIFLELDQEVSELDLSLKAFFTSLSS